MNNIVNQPDVLLSVILPTYNASEFIRESISSILNQTYSNFELLIIEDGSIDDTKKIIKSFHDKRIRLISNGKNIGLIRTLNKGIQEAKGHYIVRMDQDDICAPNRLERQLAFMENRPEVGASGTNVQIIQGKVLTDIKWSMPETHQDCIAHSLFNSPLLHPTTIIRKSLLHKHRLVYPDFTHAEDFGLWLEIAKHSELANIPEILVYYRKHKHQTSHQNARTQISNTLHILSRYHGLRFDNRQRKLHECLVQQCSKQTSGKELLKYLLHLERLKGFENFCYVFHKKALQITEKSDWLPAQIPSAIVFILRLRCIKFAEKNRLIKLIFKRKKH